MAGMKSDVLIIDEDLNLGLDEDFDEDERYSLTPKGIFTIALADAGFIENYNDRRINTAWTIFELLMEKNGYIHSEEDSEFESKLP